MKKVTSIISAFALLAYAAAPAFAVGNDCINSTTGPLSNNSCSIFNTSNATVNNVNDAKIVNNVVTESKTGDNSASMNTLGGSVVTGNASLAGTVSSIANVNTTNISGGLSAASNSGRNDITGPSSTNTVWVENEHRATVYNSNTATVDNNVTAQTNTGDNNANTNTGPAVITTGDSESNLVVGTHVNDNLTDVNLGSVGTGVGNVAGNSTTGPLSANSVSMFNRNFAAVNNVNDMIVTNNVAVLAKSGGNSASMNTLGGDIATGRASAGVGVDTEGNINTTRVALAMSDFNNLGGNDITGPGDTSTVWVENTQNTVVDNWNNKCRSHNAPRLGRKGCNVADLGVVNNVIANSDSGGNLADTNTYPGAIVAGLADLMQQVLVHINDSLTEIAQ